MSAPSSIAIVGVGAVLPGAADLRAFWRNVLDGRDAARDVPPGRWLLDPDDAFDPEIGALDKVYSIRGCYVEDLPKKSALGLDIAPDVLAALDPAFHLLLHAGHAAWRDASTERLDRARVSVIIGNIALPTEEASALARDYLGRAFEEKVLGQHRSAPAHGPHPLNRYVTGLPAGVLAKALGLGGGALTLDAACASSLYALKLAADELESGRADAVLAGGLSRPDSLYTQMGFCQLRALSPSGRCSPFDAKADGIVVGEGCGIVLLKRIEDALRDGDRIHAVIRGIGLSNDISGKLLAPMSEGQLRAMRAAYRRAGWAPWDVDLIECHATGTPVGDAVEVESLRTLWGAGPWEAGQCVIGSVKSNIGHLLTAAGSAALIKVLFALRDKQLPPTAHFERPAPNLGLNDSPFRVLTQAKPWSRRDTGGPRRAAVSAFGFGGVNAHVLLEEWDEEAVPRKRRGRPKAAPRRDGNPGEACSVAIVGMDAFFGPWTSLRAFQEHVLGGGRDHAPEAPKRWWGVERSAWFRAHGPARVPFKGHYIHELDTPLDHFRIPPRELEEMLPQQLLMLLVADRALADAGIKRRGRDGAETDDPAAGVFIGLGLDLNTTNFHFRWSLAEKAKDWAKRLGLDLSEEEWAEWTASLRDAAGPPLTANRVMGALGSIVASRIAREFRFGGPSFALSSEESSGARALEAAVRALQRGEIDRALVGAVDLAGDVRAVLAAHRGRPYSAAGRARPFDERADGALAGEGAAAVVLKRLGDAERDGDRVYAVIRGIGVARGGGVECEAPSEDACLAALERAYAEAGAPPESAGYIEAHGSGCPEEDRVEARALATFFKSAQDAPLAVLGSAKADVGHAGAASALASIVKAALCLYQEVLPPLRACERARAELAAHGHRLYPSPAPQYWLRDRARGPRRAGVNALSIDGNCVHVVLESCEGAAASATPSERLQPLGARREGLFVIEANNVQALSVGLTRLRSHVERTPGENIETLARRWWRENRDDPAKALAVAFVARSGPELLDQIEFASRALAETPQRPIVGDGPAASPALRDRVFFNPAPAGGSGKIAFVFPGSGNQYLGMGRELSVEWPEIFRKQDQENRYLRGQFQPDLFWNRDSIDDANRDHKAALFGQVALGTAVSDLVQHFGVRPQAVVGYSLGETTGLFALHAWTDRDLMLERINASTLFTEDLAGKCNAARKAWKLPATKTVNWALGVIDRPAKVVRAALKDHKKVYSLIVNTLHECVVGGDAHAVEKLVKKLDCEFFPLHGVTTVHCEVAKEVQAPYRELHLLETTPPRDVRFYSGAWGTAYHVSKDSAADSVLAQAIYGIDYPKLIEAAYDDGVRVFLEMGPGASCSRMIGEILGERPHLARSACYPGQDAVSTMLRFLGRLAAERVPVDLSVLYGQETCVLEHRDPAPPGRVFKVRTGGAPFHVVLPAERARAKTTPIPGPALLDAAQPEYQYEPAAAAPRPAEWAAEAWPEEFVAAPFEAASPLLRRIDAAETAKAEAHAAFLRFSESTARALSDALAFQMAALESLLNSPGTPTVSRHFERITPDSDEERPALLQTREDDAPPDHLDREQCLEFAVGSIGKVLGPRYAGIDSHPTRVRLPDEPLMLVDRIVSIQGGPLSLGGGRVVTEHDVLPGAWYLDGGRVPTCIAVEAGQADLFLSAYLGIDFETKGLAVYRLLDAAVTFHDRLPRPGDVIRYDIRIERFFRQGDTRLFRFNFDATVNGRPLLTMREGCAGFFTAQELAAGQGLVRAALDTQPARGVLPDDWAPLAPMARESYSEAQLDALRAGDLAGCFGPAFRDLPLRAPLTLPGGRMDLVDRVTELDPNGGRYGLGLIRAEMDVFPDDWFLTCHFVDDRVMPGTLMYECCLHTLRIFLMRLGWVGEADQAAWEPVGGVASRLKCRGQVVESTERVAYEVEVRELGYNPHPYALADAIMYADGRPIVEITNLAVQLTGPDRAALEGLWRNRRNGERPAKLTGAPLFDREKLLEFAVGSPSKAFGAPYAPFDRERVIARLPGPPFQFIDRVIESDAAPWKMAAGGSALAEYDVPPDAWYFDAERQGRMPFSVLLEVALQPCGWLAAYMGSALASDTDLKFRNLGGSAVQHRAVTPETGALRTRVACTNVSRSAGMIIQHYDFEVRDAAGPVYAGNTYFGFFSEQALANQVGVRDVAFYGPSRAELSVSGPRPYPDRPPYPGRMVRMIDRIEVFAPNGGPRGLGFIEGAIDVDPDAWFFKAHFHQDPVWPGSLGLEALVQLLKFAAVERWAVGPSPRLEAMVPGAPHAWLYRGQVLPNNRAVAVQAVITEIDDDAQHLRADGLLAVDGRVIYQMTNFTIRLREE